MTAQPWQTSRAVGGPNPARAVREMAFQYAGRIQKCHSLLPPISIVAAQRHDQRYATNGPLSPESAGLPPLQRRSRGGVIASGGGRGAITIGRFGGDDVTLDGLHAARVGRARAGVVSCGAVYLRLS